MNKNNEEQILRAPDGRPIPASEMKERLAEFTVGMCEANGVDPKDLLETLKEKYGDNK